MLFFAACFSLRDAIFRAADAAIAADYMLFALRH